MTLSLTVPSIYLLKTPPHAWTLEAANTKQMKYDILCISEFSEKQKLCNPSLCSILWSHIRVLTLWWQLVTGLRGWSHENFVSED